MTLPCNETPERVALFLKLPDEAKDARDRDRLWHRARALCLGCPILTECQEDVLRTEADSGAIDGVAGGLLPTERPHGPHLRQTRHVGRNYDPAPCGTETARRRHKRNGEQCAACYPAVLKRPPAYIEKRRALLLEAVR